MNYKKIAISIPDQIEKLEGRGLKFGDKTFAERTLSNISYYRLRAYTYPFQDNEDAAHTFVKEISFEEIISLYYFDSKLRILLFSAIEKIEISFRTQIIYHFAMAHGSHWQLRPELYRNPMYFANHLDSLQKEIDRSNETFIEHYKHKYSNPAEPPSWMSLEVATMGLLSKIFQNLKKGPEKNAITRHYGLYDVSILESWMLCISTIRNICAHHSRLWNRRLVAKPKLPTKPMYEFIIDKTVYTNKLYASLCCVAYLLKITNPECNFTTQLSELMDACPLAQHKEMGFPANWQSEPFWKI